MEVAAKFRVVPFREMERARGNWERVSQHLPPALMAMIPPLLQEVPDPDAALNLLERLVDACGTELLPLFRRHPSLLHYTLTIFGHSLYLGETILQNTDLLQGMLRQENLDRSHSHEEFREAFARFQSRSFEIDMAVLLARFRRREYVRIMLRDLLGLASLADTTAEISALSDVLIEEALRWCESEMHRRYGTAQRRDPEARLMPVPFAVLALGKLGGNELNYSSDVDLLFVYGDGERDEGAPITNREYFVRLGQQVTSLLSRVTPEGFVFRIDLRLRPQGREGEAAISVGQAIEYYSNAAQDWERQAMIKLRHCAGDVKLARRFIRGVQEHVYTEHLNFAAIETALETRDRMAESRRTGGARASGIDVKLDRGGIRDIEFLVQCLQRVYGGKEKWLRSGGTLFSLQKLHDKRHISGSDFHELTTAYEFLRRLEHRLQLRRGQQTHRIPDHSHEAEILARSLGRSTMEVRSGAEMVDSVRQRMASVAAIYNRIVHQQQRNEMDGEQAFALQTQDVDFGRVPSDHQLLQRLSLDHPAIYEIAVRKDLEGHTKKNLLKFLSSAFTTESRYRAVKPEALTRALELFRYSDFLTDILVRHPEDLGGLNELRTSSTRHQKEALFATPDSVRGGHSSGLEDYLASDALTHGEKLALLRRRYRLRLLLSGARDVVEARPFLAFLADTTAAADEAISAAFAVAGCPEGLAVFALGRLGTLEFDCASDADLLFVRDKSFDAGAATRAAEEVVEALSAYTSEGSVMAVDLRLRPHGGEGELVVTPEKLEEYFRQEAQPWEALTYTKMRFISGCPKLSEQARLGAKVLFGRFVVDECFAAAIREMRSKLERSEKGLKTSPGGMYDIDFLTAFLLIRHKLQTAEGTTLQRLQKLGEAGIIANPDLQVLLDGLEFYRTLEHAIRLVTGRPTKNLPVSEVASRSVSELVSRMTTRELRMDVLGTLQATQANVREVFDRVVR